MKHDVYCDYEFLEEFINQLKGKDLIEYLNSGDDYGIDLYRLLFNSSKIELNKTAEEINQLSNTNPYFKKLLKSQSLISSNINTSTLDFEQIMPNMVFFLGISQIEAEKLREKYGMWFFSKANLTETKKLFVLENHNFNTSKENPFKDFGFFYSYRHPCNSLVITDDYFFTSGNTFDENAVEKYLKPILRRIIPQKLEVDFQITIISTQKYFTVDEKRIKDILNIVKPEGIRIKLNFINFDFHERHIFTNYYKITADKGLKTKFGEKNAFEFRTIFCSKTVDLDYVNKLAFSKTLLTQQTVKGDSFKNRLLQ